jgi:DNA-directed RNA polymerase subunit beta
LETPAENRNDEGLFKVFAENFPIADSRENFVLEFIDYSVDPPKYSVDECIDRGLTYSVPLKAKLRLICNDDDNEDFETIEQEVFLGNIPYMTERGSFVINGAERVIVSQLHRSPGYSSLKAVTQTVQNCTQHVSFLSKVLGLNLLLT